MYVSKYRMFINTSPVPQIQNEWVFKVQATNYC